MSDLRERENEVKGVCRRVGLLESRLLSSLLEARHVGGIEGAEKTKSGRCVSVNEGQLYICEKRLKEPATSTTTTLVVPDDLELQLVWNRFTVRSQFDGKVTVTRHC